MKIMHVEDIHIVYADVPFLLGQSEFTNFNPAGGYIKSGSTRLCLVAEENSSIVW